MAALPKFIKGGLYTFQYPQNGEGPLSARVVLIVDRFDEYITGFDITRLGYRSFRYEKITGYVVKINDPQAGVQWTDVKAEPPTIEEG